MAPVNIPATRSTPSMVANSATAKSTLVSTPTLPSVVTVDTALAPAPVPETPVSPSVAMSPSQSVPDDLRRLPKDSIVISEIGRADVVANDVSQLISNGPAPNSVQVSLASFQDTWRTVSYPHKSYQSIDSLSTAIVAAKAGKIETEKLEVHPSEHTYNIETLEIKKDSPAKATHRRGSLAGAFDALSPTPASPHTKRNSRSKSLNFDKIEIKGSNILQSYNPLYNWGGGTEARLCGRRQVLQPHAKPPAFRLYVHIQSLAFAIGDIEPFFGELALYDINANRKVSETFSFQLNSPEMLKHLRNRTMSRACRTAASYNSAFMKSTMEMLSKFDPSTKAIFSLARPRSSVHIVLLVYKCLQGSTSAVLDAYAKCQNLNQKERELVARKAAEATKRHGQWRQLFVWGASPLFTEEGKCRADGIQFRELYRPPKSDEGMTVERICECAAMASSKRKIQLKQIPGQCSVRVKELSIHRAEALRQIENEGTVINTNAIPVSLEASKQFDTSVIESIESITAVARINRATSEVDLPKISKPVEVDKSTPTAIQQAEPSSQMDKSQTEKSQSEKPQPEYSFSGNQASGSSGASTKETKNAPPLPPRPARRSTGNKGKNLDSLPIAPDAAPAKEIVQQPKPEVVISPAEAVKRSGLVISTQKPEIEVSDHHLRSPTIDDTPPTTPYTPEEKQFRVDQSSEDMDAVNKESPVKEKAVEEAKEEDISRASTSRTRSDSMSVKQSESILDDAIDGKEYSVSRKESVNSRKYDIIMEMAELPLVLTNTEMITNAANPISDEISLSHIRAPLAQLVSSAGLTQTEREKLEQLSLGSDGTGPFHLEYENILHVFPQEVQIKDARNVCIGIQLKDTYANTKEEGLNAIFAHSSHLLTPAARTNRAYTGITYHCPRANFVDDFKIELPAVVHSKHHLLFTFYNVSCKDSKDEKEVQDRKVLGYSVLPLLCNNRPVDESYHLPIFKKLPNNYLAGLKDNWNERKKSIFQLRLRLRSSIYTTDPYLNRFMEYCTINRHEDPTKARSHKNATEVVRAGLLNRPSRLKTWDTRWYTLNDRLLTQHKSVKEQKIVSHFILDERTRVVPVATKDSNYQFILKTEAPIVSPTSPTPPPMQSSQSSNSSSRLTRSSTFVGNANANAGVSPVSSPVEPRPSHIGLVRQGSVNTIKKVEETNIPSPKLQPKAQSALPAQPANDTLVTVTITVQEAGEISVAVVPTSTLRSMRASMVPVAEKPFDISTIIPPESKQETEMVVQAEDEYEYRSWMHAIVSAKISRWNHLCSVRGIRQALPETVTKFFPVIMRQILTVLCATKVGEKKLECDLEELKATCFAALLDSCQIVENGTKVERERCSILDAFVVFMLDDSVIQSCNDAKGSLEIDTQSPDTDSSKGDLNAEPKNKVLTYEAIGSAWLQMIKNSKTKRSLTRDLAAKYSWFLLDMIHKSLVLNQERKIAEFEKKTSADNGQDECPRINITKIDVPTRKLLSNLVEMLTGEVAHLSSTNSAPLAQRLNRNLSLFVRDLFYVYDRSIVFDLVAIYLRTTAAHEKKGLARFKFIFLQIVCDHEDYVSLNREGSFVGDARAYLQESARKSASAANVKSKPTKSSESAESVTSVKSGHFLPLVLIKQIDLAFKNAEPLKVLGQATYTLRQVLTKHAYDSRYQTEARKAYVAFMYIRLIPCIWEHLSILNELPTDSAKKELLACALFVLNNVPTSRLYHYWSSGATAIEPQNVADWFHKFVKLLTATLMCFEYPVGKRIDTRTTVLCSSLLTADDTALESDEVMASHKLGALNANAKNQQASAFGPAHPARSQTFNSRSASAKRIRPYLPYAAERLAAVNGGEAKRVLGNAESRMYLADGSAHLIEWERTFSAQASNIILTLIENVVVPFSHSALMKEDTMQADLIWFFHGFLTLQQSDKVLQRTFQILRDLLAKYSKLLWATKTRQYDPERCTRWWFQLIRHCSFQNQDTRDSASLFIYQLFHSIFNEHGTCTRIRGPCIRAFARVFDHIRQRSPDEGEETGTLQSVSQEVINDSQYSTVIQYLQQCCSSIVTIANSDPRRNQLAVSACVIEIVDIFTRLQAIITTSAQLHSVKALALPVELRLDLCVRMISLYEDAPRMRIAYHKHMYDLNRLTTSLPEAAASQLQIAEIIHSQMAGGKELRKSNIKMWTAEQYIAAIRHASELLEQCEWYESAIDCESKLLNHYHKVDDWENLAKVQKRILGLYEKMSSISTVGDTRSFSAYYRVGFYGAAFGEEDGAEYVYREPALTKLVEISKRLTGIHGKLVTQDITIFPDSKKIDRTTLDTNACKLQITALTPFFGNNPHSDKLSSAYSRNHNISQFVFDTPFTTTGRSHGSVNEQHKLRAILTVDGVFPSDHFRIRVIDRAEIILTPIECVIEDIGKRIVQLKREARPHVGSPDLKTLSQVLTGSVTTQVNGGANEVCATFLAPETRGNFDAEKVEQLAQSMRKFFTASRRALLVHCELGTEPSERRQQDAWQEGFDQLMSQCSPLIWPLGAPFTLFSQK